GDATQAMPQLLTITSQELRDHMDRVLPLSMSRAGGVVAGMHPLLCRSDVGVDVVNTGHDVLFWLLTYYLKEEARARGHAEETGEVGASWFRHAHGATWEEAAEG